MAKEEDLEDMGSDAPKEMITREQRAILLKQGYGVVGSHRYCFCECFVIVFVNVFVNVFASVFASVFVSVFVIVFVNVFVNVL